MADFLVSLLVLSLCFYIFTKTLWIWHINQARRKGIYPLSGKATLFDVKRLLEMGERVLAVKVYQELFRVKAKDAQKAVDEMEKNIKKY